MEKGLGMRGKWRREEMVKSDKLHLKGRSGLTSLGCSASGANERLGSEGYGEESRLSCAPPPALATLARDGLR